MNATHFRLLTGLTLALPMLATPGIAPAQSSPLAATPPPTTAQVPVYKPPLLGAPAPRVGGASRGSPDNDGLTLSVLAPESTGLTRRAQPTLYWCSSKSLTTPLEFSLNDDHSIKPLVEMKLNAALPGIHALHLTYPLKTGVEYQWAIAAVADPNQRAGDLIAGGTIQRVEPTPALAAQLGPRPAAVVRDLTKLHEEVLTATLPELAQQYQHREPRGEIVLLVGPPGDEVTPAGALDHALQVALQTMPPGKAAARVYRASASLASPVLSASWPRRIRAKRGSGDRARQAS